MALDPDSPVPLYHQIAQRIRALVASGDLPAGAELPPLRAAASRWGVNLHTVRHAYAELAREGLVATRPPFGTRVLAPSAPADGARAFVARMVREAGERHALSPAQLVSMIEVFERPAGAGAPTVVHVVECSEAQCADLAAQIERRFLVEARPWCLSREGQPPAGPVVATYFHYNEARLRWPHRMRDIDFVTIRPDPGLVRRVRASLADAEERTPRPITLHEFDQPTADAVAADLAPMFPARSWRIARHMLVSPGATPAGEGPHLFAPRVWAALPEARRRDPRSFEVRYIFDDDELDAVARRRSLRRRTAPAGALHTQAAPAS